MWPFNRRTANSRRKRRRVRDVWKPSAAVLNWSKKDALSLETAYSGIYIGGATGAAKTTSSGAAIAEGLLKLGAGGLVLTGKKNEVGRWLKYCRQAGRSRDAIVFDRTQGFNFIQHELEREGSGAGQVENVVDLLTIACEIAGKAQAERGEGQEEGRYWLHSRRTLGTHAVVVLKLGHGTIGVREIHELVNSAPTSLEEKDSAGWRANSFFSQCLQEADRRCPPEDRDDLELAAKFFTRDWPRLHAKTRTNVTSTLTSMTDILVRGAPRDMLCGRTTIYPEDMEDGRVVIMGVPAFEHGMSGALVQGVVKYCFQRALRRRNVATSPRPVFIFADEAQVFLNSFDAEFVATCRESRVVNIYLTQNLPSIYAALGGIHKGKAEADVILGNLNLKIWHGNGDPTTNEWASMTIGQTKKFFFNANTTYQPMGWWSTGIGYDSQVNAGVSESYDFAVHPSVFTRLRTGGRRNNWLADAIVFQSGHQFEDTGTTWRMATFRQKF